MVRAYEARGVSVRQAWGMTETTSLAAMSDGPADHERQSDGVAWRARQGLPLPFIEFRARGEDGLVPWDGRTPGELEVRGATVAGAYFKPEPDTDGFTSDGWLKTGDIVTIDEDGAIEIRDRAKDLIKSGGEWISSMALENVLMEHPAVADAAVIGIPHPKWDERPQARDDCDGDGSPRPPDRALREMVLAGRV
jgi:fatty-acyl-CoA synthase